MVLPVAVPQVVVPQVVVSPVLPVVVLPVAVLLVEVPLVAAACPASRWSPRPVACHLPLLEVLEPPEAPVDLVDLEALVDLEVSPRPLAASPTRPLLLAELVVLVVLEDLVDSLAVRLSLHQPTHPVTTHLVHLMVDLKHLVTPHPLHLMVGLKHLVTPHPRVAQMHLVTTHLVHRMVDLAYLVIPHPLRLMVGLKHLVTTHLRVAQVHLPLHPQVALAVLEGLVVLADSPRPLAVCHSPCPLAVRPASPLPWRH